MRKKRRSDEEVELNLAAMLDMAFQLLTFFILTFKTEKPEQQITLRLPPPDAIVTADDDDRPAGSDRNAIKPPKGLTTLGITVASAENQRTGQRNGYIDSFRVGTYKRGGDKNELNLMTLDALDKYLTTRVFNSEANPYEQVIISVYEDLRYDQLIEVIKVCAKQKVYENREWKPLSKLSLVKQPLVYKEPAKK